MSTKPTTYLTSTAPIVWSSITQSSKWKMDRALMTSTYMKTTNNYVKSQIQDKCQIWTVHMSMMDLTRAHAKPTKNRERQTAKVPLRLRLMTHSSELATTEWAVRMSLDYMNYYNSEAILVRIAWPWALAMWTHCQKGCVHVMGWVIVRI